MDDSDTVNSSNPEDMNILVPDSDDDNSLILKSVQNITSPVVIEASDDSSAPSPELAVPLRKNKKTRILDSSEEDSDSDGSVVDPTITSIKEKSKNTSTESGKDEESFILSDDICSSTRSSHDKVNALVLQSTVTTDVASNKLSPTKNKDRNIIEVENDDSISGPVIKIDSESEEDNYVIQNELYGRLNSLLATEIMLKDQVSEVLKSIEMIKNSLRTANLSALPDKGRRMQDALRRELSKLQDLGYQQNTLDQELWKARMQPEEEQATPAIARMPEQTIHKLPSTSYDVYALGKKVQPNVEQAKPAIPRMPEQKIFKLPSTTYDVYALGRKAMETHRTQQALTVDALTTLHNSLKNCPSEETIVQDPRGLTVELMPHQRHALAWMLWREKEKPSGGILADDMGLGKTLTLISLILKSYEDNGEHSDEESDHEHKEKDQWTSSRKDKMVPGKTLVICPASLIGQWECEVRNRVRPGLLNVMIHHGPNREKKAQRISRPDVVITTYSILPREEASQAALFGVRWQRIIIDEAHQIRNYKSQSAQAIFKLKGKSRWALTGTPVHNKQLDLYSLIKFLRCAPFDDLAVWKRWVDNRDAAGTQRLSTITKSLMLRRTKEGLQQQGQLRSLKDKSFQTIFTELQHEEQEAYEKLLMFSSTLFAEFLHQKAEEKNALEGIPIDLSLKKCSALKNIVNPFEKHPELARLHKKMREVSDIKSHHILVLILRLRQFCCHPALITGMFEKEEMANDGIDDADGLDIDLIDQMTRMSLGPTPVEKEHKQMHTDGAVLSVQSPLFAKDRLSSKMCKVVNHLQVILQGEDKVVVVSQWVSLLDLIHNVLKQKKVKCATLTGQVPVKDRADIVARFNEKGHGPRVLFLSLTAGGVGLNLVGGNHLLLLDLHWNPQLESQACDRIYRVGQEKDVQVYKFVVSNTIEERILKLQENKLNMAAGVLTGTKHTSKLSLDDLKMLFQM